MQRDGRDIRVWILLTTVYIVWGSTYLGIGIVIETMPPLFSGGLRFVVAAAILGTFLLIRSGPGAFTMTRREFLDAAVVGLLLLTGGNGMVAVAEQHISTGLAALLVASTPLWLVIMRLVFRDRPHVLTLTGVLIGFLGVAGISLTGGVSGGTVGVVVILIASFSWAIGSFMSGRAPMPKHPFAASTVEMVVGGAGLLIGSVLTGEHFVPAEVSARSWWALVYLILVGSLVGFTSYVWLLGNAPISLVSTYAYVNPVVAVALGMIILGETVTAMMVAAGLVIVAGVALVVSTERKRVT
ncbi:EamA family transporter [Herbidospora sp. RD11066]